MDQYAGYLNPAQKRTGVYKNEQSPKSQTQNFWRTIVTENGDKETYTIWNGETQIRKSKPKVAYLSNNYRARARTFIYM